MWHTFEHLVIYPSPLPEFEFPDYKDFATHKLRVCVRHAMRSDQWRPGEKIDADYRLCHMCNTPKNLVSKQCSWNCRKCRGCTKRKAWSAMCEGCWSGRDVDKMIYGISWSEWNLRPKKPKSKYMETSSSNPSVKRDATGRRICGSCLGLLDFTPGSTEVCVCRFN
jgi:hypothetical protein